MEVTYGCSFYTKLGLKVLLGKIPNVACDEFTEPGKENSTKIRLVMEPVSNAFLSSSIHDG